MTVPQAWFTLLGLGVLAAFLCWISETWRDVFGFFAMAGIVVGGAYAALWCVVAGMLAVSTLLGAP